MLASSVAPTRELSSVKKNSESRDKALRFTCFTHAFPHNPHTLIVLPPSANEDGNMSRFIKKLLGTPDLHVPGYVQAAFLISTGGLLNG